MVKDIEHGTLLGKCAVDGQPIYEGSGARSKNIPLSMVSGYQGILY